VSSSNQWAAPTTIAPVSDPPDAAGPEGPGSAPSVGAAIDVGSNSVHALVAKVADGVLVPMVDESVLLGLGAIVDREGRLPAEACEATVEALRGYVERARQLGARHITLVATEPLRRASNRSVLQADVQRATGLGLHLLSHEAEAELTLLGVTHGRRPRERLLVVDIGGGSTELILATPGGDPVVDALPTGSSRLTAAFVAHDPPTWFEINALRAEATRLLDAMPQGRPERGVIVGGTGSNLVKILPDDPEPGLLSGAKVEQALALLSAKPAAALVSAFGINLRRAGQLAAGAALAGAVLGRYGLAALEVSGSGLREGAILAASLAGDEWPAMLSSLVAAPPG
jgi:exopolyphosphatase/guanosine-5'-triphosphate,3'-diphosphate pyrophosphatase